MFISGVGRVVRLYRARPMVRGGKLWASIAENKKYYFIGYPFNHPCSLRAFHHGTRVKENVSDRRTHRLLFRFEAGQRKARCTDCEP